MYTLTRLSDELAKARDNLREVEDTISKVHPRFRTSEGRSVKQYTTNREVTEESLETFGRRTISISKENSHSSSRKRSFVLNTEEDEDPPIKRSFPSVIGQVKVQDRLSKRGKSGDEDGKADDRKGDRKPRSIFSRLSGGPAKNVRIPVKEELEKADEDQAILKRLPSLPSKVFAPKVTVPSREQALAAQPKDEAGKQRDRRMFGALVGTLQRFRREETQDKEQKAKRKEIERKLEEDANKEKERMEEERRELLMERKRRESDIKRIEWSLNRVKEFAAWEASVLPTRNFIQTKANPRIFYLPKLHNEATSELLNKSTLLVQDMIDKRQAMLNEEIEGSEKRAKRLAGELHEDEDDEMAEENGIGKENMCHENQSKDYSADYEVDAPDAALGHDLSVGMDTTLEPGEIWDSGNVDRTDVPQTQEEIPYATSLPKKDVETNGESFPLVNENNNSTVDRDNVAENAQTKASSATEASPSPAPEDMDTSHRSQDTSESDSSDSSDDSDAEQTITNQPEHPTADHAAMPPKIQELESNSPPPVKMATKVVERTRSRSMSKSKSALQKKSKSRSTSKPKSIGDRKSRSRSNSMTKSKGKARSRSRSRSICKSRGSGRRSRTRSVSKSKSKRKSRTRSLSSSRRKERKSIDKRPSRPLRPRRSRSPLRSYRRSRSKSYSRRSPPPRDRRRLSRSPRRRASGRRSRSPRSYNRRRSPVRSRRRSSSSSSSSSSSR